MKRDICPTPIAVLYVAFNVLSLTLRTVLGLTSVHILPESYIVTVLGHVTSLVI